MPHLPRPASPKLKCESCVIRHTGDSTFGLSLEIKLIEYVDIGISGTKEKRPALDRLMADAHKRKFDVVVVWKFDRFARSVFAWLNGLGSNNELPGSRH
jgi:Resolvase, N terminal domain